MQEEGMAMGSALSPFICDLYMETVEQKAISTAIIKPRIYKRYVDDTYVIFDEENDTVENFLAHLNNQAPTIKFTMEKENLGKLPFLDVCVERHGETLTTSVYRKNTDSGRTLHYESNHPQQTKRGIVNSLKHRANTHCTTENKRHEEIKKIEKNLKLINSYPQSVLKTAKKKNTINKQIEKPLATIVLPYIKKTAEKIRRECSKLNIRAVFKSSDTIGKRLTKVKPRQQTLETKNCIYSLECKCGKKYIGETCRPLEKRIKEHKKNITEMKIGSSTLAEHIIENNKLARKKLHALNETEIKIIGKEDNLTRRKIHEAIEMYREGDAISQASFDIHPAWHSLLRPPDLPQQKSQRRHDS
jgi:hypothetical protein